MEEIYRFEFRMYGYLQDIFVVLKNNSYESVYVVESRDRNGKTRKRQVRQLWDRVFDNKDAAIAAIHEYVRIKMEGKTRATV